jgi:hypothetical protein
MDVCLDFLRRPGDKLGRARMMTVKVPVKIVCSCGQKYAFDVYPLIRSHAVTDPVSRLRGGQHDHCGRNHSARSEGPVAGRPTASAGNLAATATAGAFDHPPANLDRRPAAG